MSISTVKKGCCVTGMGLGQGKVVWNVAGWQVGVGPVGTGWEVQRCWCVEYEVVRIGMGTHEPAEDWVEERMEVVE